MARNRTYDLERGMDMVRHLPEVMPEEADPYIRAIYSDIRASLRVPFVDLFFRVLANYPTYLSFTWSQLSPHLHKRTFEQAADDLRSGASLGSLLELLLETAAVDWAALGDLTCIRPFTDTIHYVLPKLLLVATAFDEELLGPDPSEDGPPPAEWYGTIGSLGWIPIGPGDGMISLPMVSPHEASDQIKAIFEAIKQRHDHPTVAAYYRALGNWPQFLQAAWNQIEPLVGSTPYDRPRRDMIEQALVTVRGLRLPGTGTAGAFGVNDAQIDEIRAILAVFRLRLIPDLLLDVTLIKALLDGPEAARSSRFSVAQHTS